MPLVFWTATQNIHINKSQFKNLNLKGFEPGTYSVRRPVKHRADAYSKIYVEFLQASY